MQERKKKIDGTKTISAFDPIVLLREYFLAEYLASEAESFCKSALKNQTDALKQKVSGSVKPTSFSFGVSTWVSGRPRDLVLRKLYKNGYKNDRLHALIASTYVELKQYAVRVGDGQFDEARFNASFKKTAGRLITSAYLKQKAVTPPRFDWLSLGLFALAGLIIAGILLAFHFFPGVFTTTFVVQGVTQVQFTELAFDLAVVGTLYSMVSFALGLAICFPRLSGWFASAHSSHPGLGLKFMSVASELNENKSLKKGEHPLFTKRGELRKVGKDNGWVIGTGPQINKAVLKATNKARLDAGFWQLRWLDVVAWWDWLTNPESEGYKEGNHASPGVKKVQQMEQAVRMQAALELNKQDTKAAFEQAQAKLHGSDGVQMEQLRTNPKDETERLLNDGSDQDEEEEDDTDKQQSTDAFLQAEFEGIFAKQVGDENNVSELVEARVNAGQVISAGN